MQGHLYVHDSWLIQLWSFAVAVCHMRMWMLHASVMNLYSMITSVVISVRGRVRRWTEMHFTGQINSEGGELSDLYFILFPYNSGNLCSFQCEGIYFSPSGWKVCKNARLLREFICAVIAPYSSCLPSGILQRNLFLSVIFSEKHSGEGQRLEILSKDVEI